MLHSFTCFYLFHFLVKYFYFSHLQLGSNIIEKYGRQIIYSKISSEIHGLILCVYNALKRDSSIRERSLLLCLSFGVVVVVVSVVVFIYYLTHNCTIFGMAWATWMLFPALGLVGWLVIHLQGET